MRNLVLALLGWIARGLDPELQSRIDALNAKVKAAEAKELEAAALARQSEARYRASLEAFTASESTRQLLDARLQESQRWQEDAARKFEESERRLRRICAETAELNAAIDARTDNDLIHAGVPKSNAGSK